MQVLERDIDRKLTKLLANYGYQTIKLSALGARGSAGWPDRLVLLPRGRVAFIELKRPGGALTPLQQHRQRCLKESGHDVGTFDDAVEALGFIQAIVRRATPSCT
jgi:hypothetical protein